AEMEGLVRSVLPAQIALEIALGAASAKVTANEAQLTQIFVNLCVNARDAIGSQPGRVSVALAIADPSAADHPARASPEHADRAITALRTGNADPGRHYAVVTVTDTGSGIDAATLKHIFEPFYTTKPHDQGTGLGLAVVDGIVHSLSGVCA